MRFEAARRNMVEGQVRTQQVNDPRVLAAMAEVPREIFVPKPLQSVAYGDGELAVGGGRSLMAPAAFARLVQLAAVRPEDMVLDIGCGLGYSAAVLAKLAATVVALDSDAEMSSRAGGLLASLAVDNVALVVGPLAEGYAAQGPYDVIIVEGSIPAIPEVLSRQLAEGGRLVAVTGGEPGRATLLTRFGDAVSHRVSFDATIGRLPGFQQKPVFAF
jgi:protein-L-isoaspartate(D-aspartate) O-methyltransferase